MRSSQDSEPKELAEVRKLVEKTLDQKQIKLTGTTVGLIGLDPSGSVGKVFDVEGLPTIVILDAKGTVQSAHVGFSPDIREKLTAEIEALLAGKSLAKGEKPREAARKPGSRKEEEVRDGWFWIRIRGRWWCRCTRSRFCSSPPIPPEQSLWT